MPESLEDLIKLVYRGWKAGRARKIREHPADEELVCLAEGRLSPKESRAVKSHLAECDECGSKFSAYVKLRLLPEGQLEAPLALKERLKALLVQNSGKPVLEIFLRFKEKMLELVSTSGDVLVGQELVPAPLLRARRIGDFKDGIDIFRDFEKIRVEVKIEKKGGGNFNLQISAKEKQTQRPLRDIRVTLIKDKLELESYLADSGGVNFENLTFGKYRIEISDTPGILASVVLDVRI
ncbi:MAG: hypothetical protein WC469_04550 [Candidatus Omnitrophota bacterium]|jgi:hypothetical protein